MKSVRGTFNARCKVSGKVSVKYFLPPIIRKGKLKERFRLCQVFASWLLQNALDRYLSSLTE